MNIILNENMFRFLFFHKNRVLIFNVMKTAGYSGTPLAKKLGIKEGNAARFINIPAHYFQLFTDFPADVIIIEDDKTPVDFLHFFTVDTTTLKKNIVRLKKQMKPNAGLWVSWYKKSAKIPTDITEDIIRNLALDNGLVDVKVCAIDEQWSGLKLVIPVKDR